MTMNCQHCGEQVAISTCRADGCKNIFVGRDLCSIHFYALSNINNQELLNKRKAETACPHCCKQLILM